MLVGRRNGFAKWPGFLSKVIIEKVGDAIDREIEVRESAAIKMKAIALEHPLHLLFQVVTQSTSRNAIDTTVLIENHMNDIRAVHVCVRNRIAIVVGPFITRGKYEQRSHQRRHHYSDYLLPIRINYEDDCN